MFEDVLPPFTWALAMIRYFFPAVKNELGITAPVGVWNVAPLKLKDVVTTALVALTTAITHRHSLLICECETLHWFLLALQSHR